MNEEHDPVCPPESRCKVCWPDDDGVIKALVAERDQLQKALDIAYRVLGRQHDH